MRLCEGGTPFDTTKPSPGYTGLKDMLACLKVEDTCLTGQDWRNVGLLIDESEYADTSESI